MHFVACNQQCSCRSCQRWVPATVGVNSMSCYTLLPDSLLPDCPCAHMYSRSLGGRAGVPVDEGVTGRVPRSPSTTPSTRRHHDTNSATSASSACYANLISQIVNYSILRYPNNFFLPFLQNTKTITKQKPLPRYFEGEAHLL
jgi:hypothetical protein